MNKQIKDLLDRAHTEAFQEHCECCAKTGQDPLMPYAGSLDEVFEKFAELIVRECIETLGTYEDHWTHKAQMELLKKHFGVEQ